MDQIKPGFFGQTVAADSRRTEFDIKNEVLLFRKTPIDYLFFGDSITHFWELSAYFTPSNKRIVNRGIGGDTTTYALKRFEADVVQLHPRMCISLIGINDAWALEYDARSHKEGKAIADVVECAVQSHLKMLQMARANDIMMAICSVLPTNMEFTNHNPERQEYAVQLNRELKKLAQQFGCIYVDYHSLLTKKNGETVLDDITYEGLHPNARGYEKMAEILRETLAKNGYEI